MYLRRKKRILKHSLIFLFLVSAASLSIVLAHFFFRTFSWPVGFLENRWWVLLITSLGACLLYKPAETLVFFLFGRVFFRRKLVRLMHLHQTALTLIQVLDLKEVSNVVVNTLAELMAQRFVILVLKDRSRERYRVQSSSGVPLASLKRLRLDGDKDPFVHYLKGKRGLVEREKALQEFSWPEVCGITRGFESLGANCAIPLFCGELWLGFLAMSGKKGGKPFSAEEGKALEDFGLSAGIALRNAMTYDELARTNERLKNHHSKMLQTTQLAAIEQLAAGIAHEIHNPLTIISGKAQLLLLKGREGLDERTVEETLKTIVKQTERAADITRKLLVFSEPPSSGKELVQFEAIVEDTLALISYQAALEEISVLKNIAKNLPPFRGEVNEVREIFLNLILNAVQAVEKKGTIQIVIRFLEKEGWIEIKIQDNGRGIRPEDLPRLFHPFFTTRDGALGLGLFITQQIVLRYEGAIHVESEPGSGSCVVIHLPAGQDAAEEGQRQSPQEIEVER